MNYNNCDGKMETQNTIHYKFYALTMKLKETIRYHMLSSKSRSIYLSDGCHQLKEQNKCSWLFELILSWQAHPCLKDHDCQVWQICKVANCRYLLTCFDNKDKSLFQKQVNAEELLFSKVEILFKNQIAMLPTEFLRLSLPINSLNADL